MTLIKYLYESKKKDKEKIEFKEIQSYKQVEKMIKDKKIKKMRKDDKLILSKYFIDKNNRDSLLRIFGQDSFDFFLSESIKLNEIEKNKKIKLKQILDYYKTFFFESKKEDIISIEKAINDQGDLEYKKYEPDFEKAKMLNDRMPLIDYLYKIKDAILTVRPNAEFLMDEITMIPNEMVTLAGEDKENFDKLISMLDDIEDVQKYYHNVNL